MPHYATGSLSAVSCSSPSACEAVGSSPYGALAERWNGIGWTIQSTPNLSDDFAALTAVSCTSPSSCEAVGLGPDGVLADEWNGTKWTVQSIPSPRGRTGTTLTAVSCASSSACVAVGYADAVQAEVTLAEAWNGTKWEIRSTPNPAKANVSDLSGVSCTSIGACIAVGESLGNSNATSTLAEAWNGTEWALQPTPDPGLQHGAQDSLDAVTCTSASSCTAVGNGYSSSRTLAEVWNGTKWSVQSTPSPSNNPFPELTGVSCTSSTACTAVGDEAFDGSSSDSIFAEAWNGTQWALQSTPTPSGAGSRMLTGLSCPVAGDCVTVGNVVERSGTQKILAEMWNGKQWAIGPAPDPDQATGSTLFGASCPSVATCTAVGLYTNNVGDYSALAETWNGTKWVRDSLSVPGTESVLYGVSCVVVGSCTAIGYYFNGTADLALAELWNGTKWVRESVPSPSDSTGEFITLSSVSCASVISCIAIGTYIGSSGERGFAEIWDGKTWAPQVVPSPAGPYYSVLQGVSCTSISSCTAVGFHGTSAGPATLAEGWNGKKWSLESGVKAAEGFLYGVSCTSTAVCIAVGSYTNASGQSVTLGEAWNGTTWEFLPTRKPAGSGGSGFLGVSCTSSVACTAVGSYIDSAGRERTLAEAWSGEKWSVEVTRDVGEFTALDAVSCISLTVCTGVGSGFAALAERES